MERALPKHFGGDPGCSVQRFILTLVVPPLLVTNLMIFWLLLRAKS